MKYIINILVIFILSSCDLKYDEFKHTPFLESINKIYLQDSLRYLSLTSSQESIIKSTFDDESQIQYKLMTFSQEKIRVLQFYDPIKHTTIINIISLENAQDLTNAAESFKQKTPLFVFEVNSYYLKKYLSIRNAILEAIPLQTEVSINSIGSASVYATLLALDVQKQQMPISSVVMFGATRFTDQSSHNLILTSFGKKMTHFTHEYDINYNIYMGYNHATVIRNEYIICGQNPQCAAEEYDQRHYTLAELSKHISNFPHRYIEMYHDSLLLPQNGSDEKPKPHNLRFKK